MGEHRPLRILAFVGIALASVVVVLGAFTRLVDAGLGCPDWPGCYGMVSWPDTHEEIAHAERLFPEAPYEAEKAWPEMVHRYFASSLGLLSIVVLALAYRRRAPLALPLALFVLVVVQGAFGAWTVTLKLWPQVVTAHLLGGFATLSLLWLYALSTGFLSRVSAPRSLRAHAAWALALLVVQIALGGWVTSNYAALACADFPTCHGTLLPHMDFRHGFNVAQHVGPNYLGGLMTSEARVAIQMMHRLGAVIVVVLGLALAYRLRPHAPALAWLLGGGVLMQFGLGAANVLAALPLWVATLHNAGGAALLLMLITVNFAVHRTGALH